MMMSSNNVVCVFIGILLSLTVMIAAQEELLETKGDSIENNFIDSKLRCPKCNCGMRNQQARLNGGVSANYLDYPWQAMIFIPSKYVCTGSLINDLFVLTSASCIDGMDVIDQRALRLRLLAPSIDKVDRETIERGIAAIIVHPNYDAVKNVNDIALLRLDSRVRFRRNGPLYPICLPLVNDDFDADLAIVTGYGALEEGGLPSNELIEAQVMILSADKCRETTDYKSLNVSITDGMFCAYSRGGKYFCSADSGSPIQLTVKEFEHRFLLAGVASFHRNCVSPQYPAVYTNVIRHIEWINGETQQACKCAPTSGLLGLMTSLIFGRDA